MCKGRIFWRYDHDFWRLFGDLFGNKEKLMSSLENDLFDINNLLSLHYIHKMVRIKILFKPHVFIKSTPHGFTICIAK